MNKAVKFLILTVMLIMTCVKHANIASAQIQKSNPERLFYFTDTSAARTSLMKNIDKIDIFAPQVFGINKSLTAHGALSDGIQNMVKSHQVRIMPLITNDGFRQDIIHNLLASSSAQDKIIDFMVNEAKKNNYYGWQFDLEHIRYFDRDAYSAFVEKTSKIFKRNDLALSIAAVVKVNNSTTTDWYINWSGAFDYTRLAQAVDFMSIMTYDDPESKGPTASIPFVAKTLKYILESGVPPEKISLGIPAYYWSWTISPRPHRIRSGSYGRLLSIKARVKYTEGFDNILGVPWLSFKEQGIKYIVWFENQKSFGLKTKLIQEYSLRGFSMWALGMEDPQIWN